MNRSTFCEIKYKNRMFVSKAMYMIGVGFVILARTPVPKLHPSYPHPQPRPHKDLDVFCLIKKIYCYVQTGLPGLNQYAARTNVSCSMT